ncbi:hypothetical protein HMPREF1142_0700 [Peptostreptococcaceae bacterium AS15]|nr:hypothetical protein HMPREF1142_0700 [Peptostreptococcaceae bacterium AS15]
MQELSATMEQVHTVKKYRAYYKEYKANPSDMAFFEEYKAHTKNLLNHHVDILLINVI